MSSDAPLANHFLAMVPLRSRTGLNTSRIVDAWASLFPSSEALRLVGRGAGPFRQGEGGGSDFEFMTGDSPVWLCPLSVPIPEEGIAWACEHSWMWQDGESRVPHTSHVLVLSVGEDSRVESALRVTRLCAAIVKAGDAAAVYWGAASMIHKPEVFLEMVKTDEGRGLRTMLWVNIIASVDDDGHSLSLSTLGMEALGHREFEIVSSRREIGELRELLYDSAEYVLENGPVLEHGQTFGRSEDERLTIEVGPSALGKDGEVIRLGVP
jgi:hypothetical protein